MKYANSLLFKISGNGLKKPSWIFGTIHMLCSKDFEIKEKVLKALHKCSHYYMEVDLGDHSEMELMQSAPEIDSNFIEDLSEEQRVEFDQIISSRFGTNVDEIGKLPPMALINKLTMDAMGCDDFRMIDIELMQEAVAAGLLTGGLETARQQMQIAEQVFNGKELFLQLKSSDEYKEIFPMMVHSYRTENLSQLASFINNERFMSREAFRILVTDRNKRWSIQIPGLIKDESMFIAIGAGHLPGEQGVISLLRGLGYVVNPVYR